MKALHSALLLGLCVSIGFTKGTSPPEVWIIRGSPTLSQLNDVAYGEGQFVAVGLQNTILTSSNGTSWVPRSGATTSGDLFAITHGAGWFVAGGREPSMIQSSTDGIHWTNRLFTLGGEEVYGVTYGEGLFVAVGRRAGLGLSYVVTSPDTVDWANQPGLPTTNTLLAVTYGNGQFVAVGKHGTILTSPEAMMWTLRDSGTDVALRSVLFHNGRFIAGGDGNTVLTSPDGIAWSAAAPPSFPVRGLASNGEVVVAVGGFTGEGRLHVSVDGLDWPGLAQPFPHQLNGVAFGGETFVAVGDQGLIVQSESVSQGVTNEWLKPTSGYWEEPFWSLGELPSLEHAVIQFSNPGFKALAIGPNTTANFPESLTISNLLVFGSGNLLLLNYAGLEVPLRIDGDFLLGPGAELLSYYSALSARHFYVGGTATFAENSAAEFGTTQVGYLAPGEMNISNAVVTSERLFVGDPSGHAGGRVNQFGGTHRVTSGSEVEITTNGAYHLAGGTFAVPSAIVFGGGPVPQLSISGGLMDVAHNLTLFDADALLAGGQLEAAAINLGEGQFTQTGGLNDSGTLNVAFATQFRSADYVLAGGTLFTTNVSLGNGFGVLGTFDQVGGIHSNAGVITMWGILRTMQNRVQGRYNLSTGLLRADSVVIYGGDFNQSGGTNFLQNLLFDQYGRFSLSGGVLYSSNTIVSAEHGSLPFERSRFFQSNGIHVAHNLITENFGIYYLSGGTLITEFVDIRDAFVQSGGLHTNREMLAVHGAYGLNDGQLISTCLYLDGVGTFTQTGGTNRSDFLYMDIGSAFYLSGGMLSTSNSTVSSANAASQETRPRFVQSNGTHGVQNLLTVNAIYRLKSGTLSASNITVYPDGDFWMEGGNVVNPGRFTMYDGLVFAQGSYPNLGKLDVRLGVLARFEQRTIAILDLRHGSAVLRFDDSSDISSEWNGELVITNWSGALTGGGTDQVFVGDSAGGLTPAQLARITFVNPGGLPPGSYAAKILSTGETVPVIRPVINFETTGSQMIVAWTGDYRLLTATNVAGPFQPVANASSPYTNSFTAPQQFFLLALPP